MTGMVNELTALNFGSPSGVYEVETDGQSYEIHLPEDLTEPGLLIISRHKLQVEEPTDNNSLVLADFSLKLGESGIFELVDVKSSMGFKAVKTKTVKRICKIA